MKKSELKSIVARGEDSRLQFKLDIRNVDTLAAEVVAFSNGEGGRILIGVTDAWEVKGVPRSDVGRINQIISNAASSLRQAALANTMENFGYVFRKALEGLFIDRMEQNEEITAKFMNEDQFREAVSRHLLKEVYEQIRKERDQLEGAV
jgi:curli biogenesis system outer membrane secretion channel CsgG